MQLFGEVHGQFGRSLGLDDRSVLLESQPMAAVELLIGLEVAKISPHEAEKAGFIIGRRRAEKNIGLALKPAGLPALNEEREWQIKLIGLSRRLFARRT